MLGVTLPPHFHAGFRASHIPAAQLRAAQLSRDSWSWSFWGRGPCGLAGGGRDRQMGRDRPGLWGPSAPRTSPPWLEPRRFLAHPEMALPDVPLAQGAQGRAFASLVIVTPFFCPSWGPLTSSQGDAQPFPPCPLWENSWVPHLRTPRAGGGRAWGHWVGSHAPVLRCSGPWWGSGDGKAPWRDHAWGRGLGKVARWHPYCWGSPPLPRPQPGRAHGGGQSGHVAAGRLASPGAGVAAFPSCSGRVPRLAGAGAGEEEALAGLQLRARQPGSAGGGRAPRGSLGWGRGLT